MAVAMTEQLLEERLKEARQSYKLNVGCEGCVDLAATANLPPVHLHDTERA
jgi:hypothetical protein